MFSTQAILTNSATSVVYLFAQRIGISIMSLDYDNPYAYYQPSAKKNAD